MSTGASSAPPRDTPAAAARIDPAQPLAGPGRGNFQVGIRDLLICLPEAVDCRARDKAPLFRRRRPGEQLQAGHGVLLREQNPQAVHGELPFQVVLFDSWFLRWTLVCVLEQLHLDWVAGCPKNRKVLVQGRWCQLQEYIRTIPSIAYRPYRMGTHLYRAFTKVLPMQNLQRQKVRLVATYEDEIDLSQTPNFYATNRKDWEPKRILMTYLHRWPTETFNEDAKGNLGFEEYQLQNLQGIRRHWYLSFIAYSLLSDQGHPGRSRWAVHGHFQSTGQRCQAVVDELLGHLVRWIAQQLQQGEAPDNILHTLLA